MAEDQKDSGLPDEGPIEGESDEKSHALTRRQALGAGAAAVGGLTLGEFALSASAWAAAAPPGTKVYTKLAAATNRAYANLGREVVKGWLDPAYYAELQKDPVATLTKAGYKISPLVMEQIRAQTARGTFLWPPPPKGVALRQLQSGAKSQPAGIWENCLGTLGSASCPYCTVGTFGCAE